jgi:hypothetical protein
MTRSLSPVLRTAGRVAWRFVRLAAAAYLLVLLLLLLLENTLLYPAPKYPLGDWDAAYLEHEDVWFASTDGTKLHGWLVEHPQPRAVVLYAHGNGEHVAYLGPGDARPRQSRPLPAHPHAREHHPLASRARARVPQGRPGPAPGSAGG